MFKRFKVIDVIEKQSKSQMKTCSCSVFKLDINDVLAKCLENKFYRESSCKIKLLLREIIR